ncbi:unnamed protein product [Allacma fusca]|uniref:Uncharacterized protein n=1 Tax=Allacma fusca TaxID=39272 RepID=A0A8J2M4T4_9HEXA|nr:unnamed protein product [Allacma fusca]
MDEAPVNILTNQEMETLAESSLQPVLIEQMKSLLGNNRSGIVQKQLRYLLAIINCDEAVITHMANLECHNCFFRGHQGWWCPYPINHNRLKQFMNQFENRHFKTKQNYRRAKNYYTKTGRWPPGAPLDWLDQVLAEDMHACLPPTKVRFV